MKRTEAILNNGLAQGLHLGAQLYVSRHGHVLADWAVGEARRGLPMRRDTILPWYSSCKPVAAVALAQLRERGELDFDEPVARFIPEFAANGKAAVTLRHVLTHTGGFRFTATQWRTESWEEIVAQICRSPLETGWIPGQRAGYHIASGWHILGEVVRRVDGRSYDRYVREEIFLPAGMVDSWIGMPLEQYHAYGERLGWMYYTAAHPPHADPDPLAAFTQCRPGASGCGPVHELGRFYEILLRGGAPLLTAESVALLTARHRVGMRDVTFNHVLDWGLGFLLDSNRYGAETVPYGFGRHCSERTFGHGGQQSSSAFADPKHGLVVAWICNGLPGEPRHQQRCRALNSAIYEDLGLAS